MEISKEQKVSDLNLSLLLTVVKKDALIQVIADHQLLYYGESQDIDVSEEYLFDRRVELIMPNIEIENGIYVMRIRLENM